MRENDINKFLNGRQFLALTIVLLVVSAWIAAFSGRVPVQGIANGVCFPSASVLEMSPTLSVTLNLVCLIGICVLMIFLNKTYSFIRDVTLIFASSFLLLELANPFLTTRLFDGSVLCLVALAVSFILFGSYQDRYPQRKVYIAFAILSACCMFQYAFMYLIPVFLVGFLQMRCMSLKSFVAMLLGVVTPFWIVLGTGFVGIDSLMPLRLENVWNNLELVQSRIIIVTLSVTAVVSLALLASNVVQTFNYKTQIRAYNGFMSVLTLSTILVMGIDYNNVLVYLPMLNCCLSIQIAHTFTINRFLRRYILYMLFVCVCVGTYVWRII